MNMTTNKTKSMTATAPKSSSAKSSASASSTAKSASTKSAASKKPMDSKPKASTSMRAEYACDSILSDKDIISDILGSQKSLITLYSTALCESSCKNMRELVNSKLSECASDQYDMFLYMNERGMYPTEPAPAPKVAQAKKMYAASAQKMKK